MSRCKLDKANETANRAIKKALRIEKRLKDEQNKEIERLNKKIEQYENPEDMTLMFMWCDEKAKDEIKRLNKENEELKHKLKLKNSYVYGCDIDSLGSDKE